MGYSTSSDDISGFKIDRGRTFRLQDSDLRFSSSSESERRFFSSNERLNDSTLDEKQRNKSLKIKGKVKGSRQKKLDDDNELDAERIYGKSPKFDDNFGFLVNRRRNEDEFLFEEEKKVDGVVFNTLEGFNDNAGNKEALDCSGETSDERKGIEPRGMDEAQDYLRNNVERKCSAGQIKRPLSQDEDVASKSGRILESPEVTPGDVGRMLNLGNALDGPRLAQANKYLSLVSLHLPVILRLSVNCPFQNVRIKCAEILDMVKVRYFQVM